MAAQSNAPLAGGFLICVAVLTGVVTGLYFRQPSIGFLVGAGTGLTLAILLWLWDRKRT